MFRSTGYFSGVPCPEEQKGCKRPYCPFRHTAKPDAGDESPVLSNIDHTIEKIKNELQGLTGAAELAGVGDDWKLIQDGAYEPIPYYDSSNNKESNVASAQRSVLPFARGPSKFKKRPKTKNMYQSHSFNTQPSTDMEYDPVVNYSTSSRIRYDKVKSITDISDSDIDSNTPSTSSNTLTVEFSSDSSENNCEHENQSSDDEDRFVIDEGEDQPAACSAIAEIFGEESEKEDSISDSNIVVISSDESDKDAADVTEKEQLKHTKSNEELEKIELGNQKNISKKRSEEIKRSTAAQEICKQSSFAEEMAKADEAPIKRKSTSKKMKKSSKLKDNLNCTKEIRSKKRTLDSDTKNPQKVRKIDSKRSEVPKKVLVKSKKGKITHKDIDATNITKYVDRDEIKKLEEDLEKADPYQECLKIFKETAANRICSDNEIKKKQPVVRTPSPTIEEFPSTHTKQRIAHVKAASSAENLRRPTTIRKRISTPAQMMMKRLDIIEEEEAKRFLSGQPTKRIAHQISGKMAAIRAKNTETRTNLRKLENKIASNPWYPKTEDSPTVCGTTAKGSRRVAHESKDLMALKNGLNIPPRPRIAVSRHSKVPSNIRQKFLTCFIDECLRITKKDHENAYSMALAEEEQCRTRSSSKTIYMSLAASTLKRLRGKPIMDQELCDKPCEQPSKKIPKVTKVTKNSISHDALLVTNSKRCKGGYTIQKKEEKQKLSTSDLYEKMCCYIMTHEQLDANGYPRPTDVPGKAEFRTENPLKPFNANDKKICARCGKEFFLSKKGKFAKVEECTYHWGRAYMTRVGKGWEKRYSCCQEGEGAVGCAICDTHVHTDNKLDRSGYVRTLSKSPPPDGNCGIFTLDCEMSYTTNGLELTRVSVLDHDCKLVYDTFVKPYGRVLDYNTRWSGITENDLADIKTTIRDVQATFLCKFSSDTILMGHSLESDLVALRIIHETVVDTSVVFPHKRGFPYKRALKNIASENLGLIIQSGAAEGHDSAEDASACMKLMLWKIEEDCKLSSKM